MYSCRTSYPRHGGDSGRPAQVTTANVRVHAEVAGIDHPNRVVTLRGSQGSLTEHTVPEDCQGFAALEVGDEVTVMFEHEIGLHLRRAGAAMPDLTEMSAPAGGAVMRTMETEVTQVDATESSISIRSGSGEEATFGVPAGMSLEDFAVGDVIDVSYMIPEVVEVVNR